MTTVAERVLEALLETAIDYAIIAMDLDGLVTSWSEGAHAILGWTADEMIGRPASIFFTQEDRTRGVPQAEMEAALAHGRGNDERWHLRRDGTCFWASGEMMPLRDTAGVTHGLIKILRDRTTQRLAEERQRADAEFLRSVLASSGDCIKVLDLDGRVLFMNEGGQRLLEISDFNAVRGCPWPDFWRDAGNTAAVAAIAAARAGGVGKFEGAADTFAGTPKYWDVQVTSIPGQDGRPEKLLAVSRDITEARQAQQRLMVSEDRLQLALGASDMVAIWDADLLASTIYGDANFARLHSMDPQAAMTGAPLASAFQRVHREDAERFRAQLHSLMAGGEVLDMEHRLVQPDGSVRWVVARGRLVRDAAGTPVRLPGALVDVTDRRETQQRQALLMEELAHRVKNTLAVVQSIAQQTLRGEGKIALAREAFCARLIALGTAHDVLLQESWTRAGLRTLVDAAGRLHAPAEADGAPRFVAEGPNITLGPRAALAFALVLHELGTNAVKYGALSVPDGRVNVAWSKHKAADGQSLHFVWSEHGGPVVAPPRHRGFGSRLIERSLAAELGAVVRLDYAAAGVTLSLDVPLSALQKV